MIKLNSYLTNVWNVQAIREGLLSLYAGNAYKVWEIIATYINVPVGLYVVSPLVCPLNTVCLTTLPYKILIMTFT